MITLGIVLFSVYYISARRDEPQGSARTPVKVAADTPTPEPTPAADAVPDDGAALPSDPPPSPSPSPAPRQEEKRAKRPGEKKAGPGGANEKKESREKESKVGSILKKTGSILKKPFKF